MHAHGHIRGTHKLFVIECRSMKRLRFYSYGESVELELLLKNVLDERLNF